MTKAEIELLELMTIRLAGMEPSLRAKYIDALQYLRNYHTTEELVSLLERRAFASIFTADILEAATAALELQITKTLQKAFGFGVEDIAAQGVNVTRLVLDEDSPRVARIVRNLKSATLDTLKVRVQAAVRTTAELSFSLGKRSSAVAPLIRDAVGLSKQQASYIVNAGVELEDLDASYFDRKLRDKRFDKKVREAIDSRNAAIAAERRGEKATKIITLDPKYIRSVQAGYARKWTAENTAINMHAVAVDAYRFGALESWQSAIDRGIVDGSRLFKEWVHLEAQDNPRPEHQAMNGEIVRYDQPYSNGDMVAGQGKYGCHCKDRFFLQLHGF